MAGVVVMVVAVEHMVMTANGPGPEGGGGGGGSGGVGGPSRLEDQVLQPL